MKRIIVAFAVAALTGCSPGGSQNNQQSAANKAVGLVTTLDEDTVADTSPGCGGEFLTDYASDLQFDTVIHIRNNAFRIAIVVDTQRKIALPHELLFGCDNQYIYDCTIKISDSAAPGRQLILGKQQLVPRLDSPGNYVSKYGQPIGLRISGIDTVKNRVSLSFSFSTPYTDLGQGLDMDINPFEMSICK